MSIYSQVLWRWYFPYRFVLRGKIPFGCILSNAGIWFTGFFAYLCESVIVCVILFVILHILDLCMPEDCTSVFWMYNGCFLGNGRNCFVSLTPAHIGCVARVRYISRTPARLVCLPVSLSCVGFTLLPVRAKISTVCTCCAFRATSAVLLSTFDCSCSIVADSASTVWAWCFLPLLRNGLFRFEPPRRSRNVLLRWNVLLLTRTECSHKK